MKRWMWLTVLVPVLLAGCGREDPAMAAALELRSRCLGAGTVEFRAEITAHYIDTWESFTLECSADGENALSFRASAPEEIAGISGTVAGDTGSLSFDGTVLAFPLTAGESVSPVQAPWIMMNALRTGCITAAVQEGELLHITVDDGYGEDALTVDLWARDGAPVEAEISREGRRCMVMQVENFGAV